MYCRECGKSFAIKNSVVKHKYVSNVRSFIPPSEIYNLHNECNRVYCHLPSGSLLCQHDDLRMLSKQVIL